MDRGEQGARQDHHAHRAGDRRLPHRGGHRDRGRRRRRPRHYQGGLRLQDTQGGVPIGEGRTGTAYRLRVELYSGPARQPRDLDSHRHRGPHSGPGAALQQVRVVPQRRQRNSGLLQGEAGRSPGGRQEYLRRDRRRDRARPGGGESHRPGEAGQHEASLRGTRRRYPRRGSGCDGGRQGRLHSRVHLLGQSHRGQALRAEGRGSAAAG